MLILITRFFELNTSLFVYSITIVLNNLREAAKKSSSLVATFFSDFFSLAAKKVFFLVDEQVHRGASLLKKTWLQIHNNSVRIFIAVLKVNPDPNTRVSQDYDPP